MVRITNVFSGSIACELGIKKDDFLVSINGFPINDVLDYRFYLTDEEITVEIKRGDKSQLFDIEKDEYEDLGLDFETPLMDKKHSCQNKCVFCFIDQLPKGLRETLYFKDDDARLSFLHGNYITLTNLKKEDIARIIKMHISPINVSVHTTNPELRCQMMHNKRAGETLSYLEDLAAHGIKINAQIVSCRDMNDGDELLRSLNDLAKLYPSLSSVAVVPSGITKFRDGLHPLKAYDKESAAKVIDLVEQTNDKYAKKFGRNIFFASDEFYLTAERELPSDEYYEDYSQLDNGVGMIRSFECEADILIKSLTKEDSMISRDISIVTGESAYDLISLVVKKVQKKCKKINCNVYKIENDFFGHTITVAGLITGKDMINQLHGKPLGKELLISRSMLRSEGDLFLCGTSLEEAEKELGVKITPIDQNGADLVEGMLGTLQK